ncbi:MAG: type IV pilus modification protein PilV [Aquificaceae bacterium]|nr:MAG: type IV pilus modification protein PilV [Aquificaceae bacterium]
MRDVSYQYQCGFNMLESMIATLVVSVGLLGVAGMQMVAMKGANHAFQQSTASDLMRGLLERMRSNSKGVYAENYNITGSANYNCSTPLAKDCEDGTTTCNAADLAKSDLHRTICGAGGLKSSLLSSSLSISCQGGAGTCATGIKFKINWNERLLGKEGGGGKTLPREISLNTVIAE